MTTANPPRRVVRIKKSKIPKSVTSRTVAVRAKQTRAAELRAAGVTYQKIAEELGYYNAGGAKKAVDAFLQDQERELAHQVIEMDLVRLDEYTMRATAALRQGDLKQIPTLIAIMNQKYALAGIAPRTVEKIRQRFGLTEEAMMHGAGVGGVTNNGVMVIGGSESDFVRSLMIATGNDPDDPKVKAQVALIETARTVREQQYGLREIEKTATENTHGGVLEEDDVVDAEIVDE